LIDVVQSLLLAGAARLRLQLQLPGHGARDLVRGEAGIARVQQAGTLTKRLVAFLEGDETRRRARRRLKKS
jgi:hypothetical protein